MPVTIKNVHVSKYSSQRVEVELSNKISFTVMVNDSTGEVKLLCDSPHLIGQQITHEVPEGYTVFKSMVSVGHYGHPFED